MVPMSKLTRKQKKIAKKTRFTNGIYKSIISKSCT